MMGRTPVSRISSAVCWICSSLVAASAGGGGCGCSVGIGFIGPIVGPPMAALLLLRERCEKSKRRGVPPSTRENRSEEHTSELQSLMRISYAVFCLQKKKTHNN